MKCRRGVLPGMSFKRVGDDFAAIKVQKRFRQSELLLEDIPEGEATLMKNGRFACLVCRHNPVFDTVVMLTIHRQGKKHLANAKIRLEKLKEDAELRQKRAQEDYLKNSKPGQGQEEEEAPLLSSTQKKKTQALQDSQKSYPPCHVFDQEPTKQKHLPFFQSRVPIDLKITEAGTETPSTDGILVKNAYKRKSDTQPSGEVSSSTKSLTNASCVPHGTTSKRTGRTTTVVQLSAEEKAKREHFAKLTRDGWVREWDGTWKKDENVEFDSDEEEPPPMPCV